MHYKNPKNGGIKRKRLNAHNFKKLFQISGQKAKVSQGHERIPASKEEDEILAKKSCFDSKRKRRRQRVDSDSEGVCFENQESGNRPSSISSMDGGECGTGIKMGEPFDGKRGSEGLCAICMASGELLLCCGQGCGKSFHRSCLDPPLPCTPPGSWHCGSCTKKKMKSGVNYVSKPIEFEEYWIPVHLSCMQIEQYCSLLDSNLEALSSCLKNNSSLHDILIQTQQCCDHPYLVDPSLRKSSEGDISIDPFDADINVSGKLQLLDKLLLEIKKCGLRVLVLFQSVVSSEKITIGDILDDLVDRRFGQDSYVRIPFPSNRSFKNAQMKKKENLNTFNNIKSGRFVCLLDYHTCRSRIRLSCVDAIILFNGDWNPLNDLKALHKITIDDSHVNQRLRVLRLYSSSTIEEKALILAKQGEILDSNLNNMHWKTCQQLLAWGASDLFNKRQSYTSEPSFIDDLVRKLSSLLLKNKNGDNDLLNGSVILKARLNDGTYAKNMLLFGETEAHTKESSSIDEYLMENEPLVFWTNLFKESHHRLKNPSSRLSRRAKKQFRNPAYWFEGFESEAGNDNVATTSPSVKTKLPSKGKPNSKIEQRKRAGGAGHFDGSSENVNGNRTTGSDCIPRAPKNVLSACRETDMGEFQRESLLCNLIEQFNHSVTQPAEQVPSTCISDSAALNSSSVQECPNDQPTLPVRPPIFQSSSTNPLETELERIEMDREQVTMLLQEKKSVLLSECEKEIAEIRKKYDALIEESEMCVTMQLKDLERNYNLVYANKILAELMPRFRYDDTLDAPLPEKTEKETTSVKITQIPASKLRQPAISFSTGVPTSRFHGNSLGLRGPAPHLRSNPSLFSSFNNLLTTTIPQPQPSFLEPLPTLSTPSNDGIFQEFPALPELPSELESFYDMGYDGLPFLSSTFGNS